MKIFVTCAEPVVREWAGYMQNHLSEAGISLKQEGVRHEMWFMGHDCDALYLIGVMDTDDKAASLQAAQKSTLSVDLVHRQFKAHWDRTRSEHLKINPSQPPYFEDCELLFEAMP